jgi:hypothetical protein
MFSKPTSLMLLNHIPHSYLSENVGKTLAERGFPPKTRMRRAGKARLLPAGFSARIRIALYTDVLIH